MKLAFRIIAVLLVVPAVYFFVYWVPFSLLPLASMRWVASLVALACAAGAGWFTWRKLEDAPQGLFTSAALGAVVLGAIGFCGGFFGPMIFAPQANQGPLLGIFITGPLGFVIGGVAGFFYGLVKTRRAPATD